MPDACRQNRRAGTLVRPDDLCRTGVSARNFLPPGGDGFLYYRRNGSDGRFHKVLILRMPDVYLQNRRANFLLRLGGLHQKDVFFQNSLLPCAGYYPRYRHVPGGYSLSLSSYMFLKLLPPGSKSILRVYSHGTKIPQLIEQNAGIIFNCGRLSVFLPLPKKHRCLR